MDEIPHFWAGPSYTPSVGGNVDSHLVAKALSAK